MRVPVYFPKRFNVPPEGFVAGRLKTLLFFVLIGIIIAVAWWSLRATLAPSVKAQTLNGQTVNTAELKGKPYLINFWATSCVTCVKEMPDIVALHQEFSTQGFQTIAVAMSYDRPDYLQRFVEERALPFHVVHDENGQWAQAFGDVSVTPTTFVIDANGQIYKRYVGEPDFQALRRWLQSELKG